MIGSFTAIPSICNKRFLAYPTNKGPPGLDSRGAVVSRDRNAAALFHVTKKKASGFTWLHTSKYCHATVFTMSIE